MTIFVLKQAVCLKVLTAVLTKTCFNNQIGMFHVLLNVFQCVLRVATKQNQLSASSHILDFQEC